MKSLGILLFSLIATSAFAAEITSYNVTVKVQGSSRQWLPVANRGVFIEANFGRGNEASVIDRRFKAQTNSNGQASILVSKSDYWTLPFNRLELFCLNLDDALYCSGTDDRDVSTPLNPYVGNEQGKVEHKCYYSLKNPLKSSTSAGEISIACKRL